MKSKIQINAQRNDFYPDCGCRSETDCDTCPNCGMCASNVEYCSCYAPLLGVDKSLQYDPFLETLGG